MGFTVAMISMVKPIFKSHTIHDGYVGMYTQNNQMEVLTTLVGSDLAEIYLPGIDYRAPGNYTEVLGVFC